MIHNRAPKPISIPGATSLTTTTYDCGCVNVAINGDRPVMHACATHQWIGLDRRSP